MLERTLATEEVKRMKALGLKRGGLYQLEEKVRRGVRSLKGGQLAKGFRDVFAWVTCGTCFRNQKPSDKHGL